MATDQDRMSSLSRGLNEDWQGLVAWDEEIYDPLFQSDVGLSSTSDANALSTSNQHNAPDTDNYVYSQSASAAKGPSSFDYVVSAPSSVSEGPTSAENTFSWLSNSPSFSTTATSPLLGRNSSGYEGSFTLGEEIFSPTLGRPTNSPLPEVEEEVIMGGVDMSFPMTSPQLFNPFVAGSSHAFNSLDMNASQVIASVGDWAEQPCLMESIPELDQSQPIPIPQSNLWGFNNSFASVPVEAETIQEHMSPRAITIPQPSRRSASYNPGVAKSRLAELVSPTNSPEPRKRLRNTLPNSPRMETRRRRSSQASLSPTTKSIGWVSYQPDVQGKGLVPTGGDINQGKRQRGRVKGLTPEQRKDAALMRIIGACSNCKRRKEKCDPGTPCKSCLEYYKGSLIQHPCRDRLLPDLSSSFLSNHLGWHPTARSLASFISSGRFDTLTGVSYTVPLTFGFGPLLRVPVHAFQIDQLDALFHDHTIYSWPPSDATGDLHTHAVLPAVLTPDAISSLPQTLDKHLSLLVTQHFALFPLYCSPLRILREVYVFYRALPTQSPYSRTLHQALKLLVLIHIGGDLTLPPPSSDPILTQSMRIAMPNLNTNDDGNLPTPTPCFIRSQFGAAMPALAHSLLKQVLSSLEHLLLNQACHEWPHTLAILIVVLMAVESIQYHASKLPYHHALDTAAPATRDTRNTDQQGVDALLRMYQSCFSGCHARLQPGFSGPDTNKTEDVFVEGVKVAVQKAGMEYLEQRAGEEKRGDDMRWFFDRLVARLLVLKAGNA